jgi:hypothetical protein
VSNELAGTVAVVTGGASGIGPGTAPDNIETPILERSVAGTPSHSSELDVVRGRKQA